MFIPSAERPASPPPPPPPLPLPLLLLLGCIKRGGLQNCAFASITRANDARRRDTKKAVFFFLFVCFFKKKKKKKRNRSGINVMIIAYYINMTRSDGSPQGSLGYKATIK